jgi:hypothetical protein
MGETSKQEKAKPANRRRRNRQTGGMGETDEQEKEENLTNPVSNFPNAFSLLSSMSGQRNRTKERVLLFANCLSLLLFV